MRVGQTLVEYTLVALAVVALAVGAFQAYGHTVKVITDQVNSAILGK